MEMEREGEWETTNMFIEDTTCPRHHTNWHRWLHKGTKRNRIAWNGMAWNEMKWKTCANILSLFCQFLSSSSSFSFSCIVSAPLWHVYCALSRSLSLSPSHLLSSFNSWCTFCDIILNPAALLCIYISVCLGLQKVSYRLYLTHSLLPFFSHLDPVSRQSIQFFDTNSVELCVLFVVVFHLFLLCNCCCCCCCSLCVVLVHRGYVFYLAIFCTVTAKSVLTKHKATTHCKRF